MNPNSPPPMNKMLIGVIALPLSSYPPEVRRGATSGLQRTCLNTLRVHMCIQMHIESYGIYWNLFNVYKDVFIHFYVYIYIHAFQRGVMVCEYVVSISVSPYCISISLYVNLFTVHIYKQSLERHISNEKHLPQLMLLGYMPLWQELQTFDILGFQRAPSPTSCMTHVWDVCEIISFFWYIYTIRLMLKILQWFVDVCLFCVMPNHLFSRRCAGNVCLTMSLPVSGMSWASTEIFRRFEFLDGFLKIMRP